MQHPSLVLMPAQAAGGGAQATPEGQDWPSCDHYCGVEARIRKSLQLQRTLSERYGYCPLDVTLDCEDGAPVGNELAHAQAMAELATWGWQQDAQARIAVRVHAIDHPAFVDDLRYAVLPHVGRYTHVMLPKIDHVAMVDTALAQLNALQAGAAERVVVHCLIESPLALQHAHAIAAHARVASLSFGLMDFVSSHNGAIPASAMTTSGQFSHPLVLQAKMTIASACHAYGKIPAHGVVTEYRDTALLAEAARKARRELGFTRMWSIHPDQIETILQAFAPQPDEVETAQAVIAQAMAADWAPISFRGTLQDRASYRYHWQVLQRARAPALRALLSPTSLALLQFPR